MAVLIVSLENLDFGNMVNELKQLLNEERKLTTKDGGCKKAIHGHLIAFICILEKFKTEIDKGIKERNIENLLKLFRSKCFNNLYKIFFLKQKSE